MCITAHRASGLLSFVIYFHIHKVFVLQSKNKVGCPVGISFYIIGMFFLISLNRKKGRVVNLQQHGDCIVLFKALLKIFPFLAQEVSTDFSADA